MKKIPSIMTTLSLINSDWQKFIDALSLSEKELFLKLESIGQLGILDHILYDPEIAKKILKQLREIDDFFESIGGIVGYQNACQKILTGERFDKKIYQAPHILIQEMSSDHRRAILECIQSMDQLAEVYAIGGAADRLNLMQGDKTLPAACLQIASKTLLEYLIADVEAKEWLYYKFHKRQVIIPIVMMTSFEKDNQAHIYEILQQHEYFNRPKDSFLIFHQPLVPMVDENLSWQSQGSQGLFLKPGGHGAIWGLCLKEGVFTILKARGIKKLAIRQINNPIACVDFGHLAFMGYGLKKDASFGFFACQRYAGSQEGINVLLEDKNGCCLTNIEYCQLESLGIEDKPNAQGFSQFPANTNVLFADLEVLEDLTKKYPLPGQILNYKTFKWDGKEKSLARLETMMQNMADFIIEHSPSSSKVFMTLSERHKTISPVKRQKLKESTFAETPQACFFDMARNSSELLNLCSIEHNMCSDLENYFLKLPFIFTYLPALGPIYEIIAQKLRGGIFHNHAYVNLHIAEIDIEKLDVKGALKVIAHNPYGFDKNGESMSDKCGRCVLHRCTIINQGLDLDNVSAIHTKVPEFLETCQIILEGFSEFYASDVVFRGQVFYKVPDGFCLKVWQDDEGKLHEELKRITQASWTTSYEACQDRFYVVSTLKK